MVRKVVVTAIGLAILASASCGGVTTSGPTVAPGPECAVEGRPRPPSRPPLALCLGWAPPAGPLPPSASPPLPGRSPRSACRFCPRRLHASLSPIWRMGG